MKNYLVACVQELKSPITTHVAAASIAAIAVAALHRRTMMNGRTFVLPQEAFDALINDETNFVTFANDKSEHVFRISYVH
jgi:hypothetical protein